MIKKFKPFAKLPKKPNPIARSLADPVYAPRTEQKPPRNIARAEAAARDREKDR